MDLDHEQKDSHMTRARVNSAKINSKGNDFSYQLADLISYPSPRHRILHSDGACVATGGRTSSGIIPVGRGDVTKKPGETEWANW